MLSKGLTGVLHTGHLEPGLIMDKFLGSLYIQTFIKEPVMRPRRKTKRLEAFSMGFLYLASDPGPPSSVISDAFLRRVSFS